MPVGSNRRLADWLSGLAVLIAACGLAASGAVAQTSGEPVMIGVSGPLTGPNAQYGAQWKQGFDLALDEINVDGGINGRPLAYVFEDSQSDPRQSVAIAQKFVADPNIVVELGDFSSPASMAASPIYQRARLVQFGFTNSHPDFTKGGDYMWSNSVSQADEQPLLRRLCGQASRPEAPRRAASQHRLGPHQQGRSSSRPPRTLAPRSSPPKAIMPDEKDFRSTLVRVRDANPDGLVLISYYSDGALIARQARQVGLKQPIVAASSVYSPKFIELGGDAVEGVYTAVGFFPRTRARGAEFVTKFKAKYNEEPDAFNASPMTR